MLHELSRNQLVGCDVGFGLERRFPRTPSSSDDHAFLALYSAADMPTCRLAEGCWREARLT